MKAHVKENGSKLESQKQNLNLHILRKNERNVKKQNLNLNLRIRR
jgi:hypothetical protein